MEYSTFLKLLLTYKKVSEDLSQLHDIGIDFFEGKYRLSDLTYSLNNRAINELESKLFIDYEVQGRSHVYFLTKNGKRLIQLYGKGG